MRIAALCAVILLGACSTVSGWLGDGEETAQTVSEPQLVKIADDVWIHKSWFDIPGYGPVLSQGLVVKTEAGVLLVDTAWTDEDTAKLIALIEEEVGARPIAGVVTHAHNDKMGGMAVANAAFNTAAFALTQEDAPDRGLAPARHTIPLESINGPLAMQQRNEAGEIVAKGGVELFYPGPGHTRDNIVVYYAPAKVLFGGCLIRPAAADNLGNAADADVSNWAAATRAVAERFPDAEIVIPSHGAMGGRELFAHTVALAEAAAANGS